MMGIELQSHHICKLILSVYANQLILSVYAKHLIKILFFKIILELNEVAQQLRIKPDDLL